MSAVLQAKSKMRALAAEATELSTVRMSAKNKNLRLDEIETEMKSLTDTIAVHDRAKALMVGGDAPWINDGGMTGTATAQPGSTVVVVAERGS